MLMLVYNTTTTNKNINYNVYSAVIIANHRESSLGSRDEYSMAPGAADLYTKPIDLSHRPAYRQPVNRIHHRHLLLLLSPKADTHFTIPQRTEG